MDFEWDRIETYKLSLMHFANANMYLHGQALEIYSEYYERLQKLNFYAEFPDADKTVLKSVMATLGIA